MPTEAEFEQAEARFRAAAEEAEDTIRPVRQATGPDVLTGGKLTGQVSSFVGRTGSDLRSIASELRSLARECAARAQQCRQAAADLAAYQQAMGRYRTDLAAHGRQVDAAAADPSLAPVGDPPTAPSAPPTPPSYVEL